MEKAKVTPEKANTIIVDLLIQILAEQRVTNQFLISLSSDDDREKLSEIASQYKQDTMHHRGILKDYVENFF